LKKPTVFLYSTAESRSALVSIFKDILAKIFPAGHPAVASSTPTSTAPAAPTATPSSTPANAPDASTSTRPNATMSAVDVEAVLSGMPQSQTLNWRTSIVDLMKLLGLDSSLAARKELAQELHYSADTSDSAAMNVWLHKQVMAKLAENGGKVPAELHA
jgi:hypothetical protein